MPLYTYECAEHGEFSAWGKMSESNAPQPCPSCAEPASRALAKPAIGGRSESADYGCGAGACGEAMAASSGPSAGGCGCAGHCVH